ncbi:phospholipase B-like protein [Cavenderia fasciculata]|uniref:Phospholipase B-like n=1 Tax=Cavenderia fasciculata TaxID=261658 RepID=F4PPS4_CACFS|nr:phospholipase B-like protein [Cavenderia fasciculata]EGG22387.1 phospholipase B-like protein [Cavenderia fasciculata]|eukprot:XP_004360238.1 phospholipase B-like protein [Cavenderia fasciculata]
MIKDIIVFVFVVLLFIVVDYTTLALSKSSTTTTIEYYFKQDDISSGSSSSSSGESSKEWYSLTSQYQVVKGKNVQGSIAWGYFKDDMLIDGWGKLSIETSSILNDDVAFKAAGYLEGYLTWPHIYNFSVNLFNTNFNTTNPKEFPIEVMNFISQNYNYMTQLVNSTTSQNDPYYQQVSNAIDQIQGLYQGYNDAADSDHQLTFWEMYLISLYVEIGDIMSAVMPSSSHEFKPMSREEAETVLAKTDHCTGFMKLASNGSELYIGHTTWADYTYMIRIYKRLKIPVASTPNGYETLMASYPGLLVSTDDFYMIRPSKLMVTETLNTLLNQTLYSLITPDSLMYWVRNLVANRLSNSGYDWVTYFVKHNSGTNNNQYSIVDYKLFTPYVTLPADTLWVVEQYPGGYQAADLTFNLLENGYWASYNRPYFQEVFDLMGYPYYVNQYGDLFTYEYNPRANILRRDQSKVDSLDDMMNVISYNEYLTDPLSTGSAGGAIAARYDLKGGPDHPYSWFYHGTHGGIDGKVMNSAMFDSYTVLARNGPTVTDECPPFTWADWQDNSHAGMPDEFNFPWILIQI